MRKRVRLTITLPPNLVRRVNSLITSANLRNRSQAIEYLISQSLKPKLNTAVILAGGRQSKQLAPLRKIKGQYLFVTMINQLKKHGISRVIVCLPKERHSQFVAAFGQGEGLGIDIEYSLENKPLGTAGALKSIQESVRGEPFLVLHGDVLTNINFQEFIQFHLDEDVPATIAVKPRLSERKYGQIFMQGNKIVKFLKVGADKGISIINTGIYVLNPNVLNMVPTGEFSLLEKDVFPVLAERSRLSAFVFQGLWFDISTGEQMVQAEERWSD